MSNSFLLFVFGILVKFHRFRRKLSVLVLFGGVLFVTYSLFSSDFSYVSVCAYVLRVCVSECESVSVYIDLILCKRNETKRCCVHLWI